MSLARELGIKRGACSRLTKELANYSDEAKATAEKVASMRAAGEAPHDVKHAVRRGEEKRNVDGGRAIDRSRSEDDRSCVFSLSLLNLLSLFKNKRKQKQTGEHRRRVRPDGPGHEAAPCRRCRRHAEAPGEEERKKEREKERKKERKRRLKFSFSLSLSFSFSFSFLFLFLSHVSFFLQSKPKQDESDLSETPEEDVKAAREVAEAAEAALAKAAADGE